MFNFLYLFILYKPSFHCHGSATYALSMDGENAHVKTFFCHHAEFFLILFFCFSWLCMCVCAQASKLQVNYNIPFVPCENKKKIQLNLSKPETCLNHAGLTVSLQLRV